MLSTREVFTSPRFPRNQCRLWLGLHESAPRPHASRMKELRYFCISVATASWEAEQKRHDETHTKNSSSCYDICHLSPPHPLYSNTHTLPRTESGRKHERNSEVCPIEQASRSTSASCSFVNNTTPNNEMGTFTVLYRCSEHHQTHQGSSSRSFNLLVSRQA